MADWKRILPLTVMVFVITAPVLLNCSLFGFPDEEKPPPPPQIPIFSGLQKIELTLPGHNDSAAWSALSFQFDISEEEDVEYLVLALFDQDIQVSGKTIVNTSAWKAGSRSGLAGFSRSSIKASNLFPYNQTSGDFDTTANYAPASYPTTYHWAVWGYDQWGNLSHSSPRWTVTVSGP